MPTYRDALHTFEKLVDATAKVRSGLDERRRDAEHLVQTQRSTIVQALVPLLLAQDPAQPSLGVPELNTSMAMQWQQALQQQARLRDEIGTIDLDRETLALREARAAAEALGMTLTTRHESRDKTPVVTVATQLTLVSGDRKRVDAVNPWAFWAFSRHERQQAAGVRRYQRQHGESFWKALRRDDVDMEALARLSQERSQHQNQQRQHQTQIERHRTLDRQLNQARFDRPQWATDVADRVADLQPVAFAQAVRTILPARTDELLTAYAVIGSGQRLLAGIAPYNAAATRMLTSLTTIKDRFRKAVRANAGSRSFRIDLMAIETSTRKTLDDLDQQRSAVAMTLPVLAALPQQPATPARQACLGRAFSSASNPSARQDVGMTWFWIWLLTQDAINAPGYGAALGLPTLHQNLAQQGIDQALLDRMALSPSPDLSSSPGLPLDLGAGGNTWDTPVLPAMPEVATPMPTFGALDVPLPGITLPDLPTFTMPDLPALAIPDIPSFTMPDIPSFTMPDVPSFSMPDVPSFSMPDTPSIDTSSWNP